MAKIKLTDFSSQLVDDAQMGTCDLCMYTTDVEEAKVEFTYEDDSSTWVDLSHYDWDVAYSVEIPQVGAFAAWLLKQDFDPDYRLHTIDQVEELVSQWQEEERER